MSPFEFHHLFVMCAPGAPEADALVAAGFTEGSSNVHPGQGTRNRRFFFENGMLELLWVHDEREARSALTAPTGLWERFHHRVTGYSPFGLCVRPLSSGPPLEAPFPGWKYRPIYLPRELAIDVADNAAQPWEPMLFCAAFFPSLADAAHGNAEPVVHANGARRLQQVALELSGPPAPLSRGLLLVADTPGLQISRGPAPLARIRVEGGAGRRALDLRPVLPLVVEP